MRILLDMGFKGNRTYLQGGDFFDAIEMASRQFTGEQGSFVMRLVFRHLARNLCELSSLPPNSNELLIGQGTYRQSGGEEKDFWLFETNVPVVAKRPYNENVLFANAVIDSKDRSARLLRQSSNTPIEDIVGLTKILNNRLMPNVPGKWLFGQIDLAVPLRENHRDLVIQMKNSIRDRFSISEIFLDGNTIGAIRFIVGEP